MKEKIDIAEYAEQMICQLSHGTLLITKDGGRVNVMTIGCGTIYRIVNESTE